MKKVIAAMNMTIDGYCDHTAGIADEQLHKHYEQLLGDAFVILYGRITYQLMEYWRGILKEPTGVKTMDDFAVSMDKVPKLVFSRTLKNLDWHSAGLARHELKDEVLKLREANTGDDKHIYVGSPSLIVELSNLKLIDEFQLCIHPVVWGKGLPLFKNITDNFQLKLLKTKTFDSGCIIHYYESMKAE